MASFWLQVKLSPDNIRMILDTLIYDGRAEFQIASGGQEEEEEGEEVQRLYRISKPVMQSTGFSRIPCGICPVRDTLVCMSCKNCVLFGYVL